jgi:outer membrane protein OmpA-like peptidoglycan-associated protein
MNGSKSLLTINLVLLAALVILLGMSIWGDDNEGVQHTADLDTTNQFLANVEEKVTTTINEALVKSETGGLSNVSSEQLASAIVERIDEAVTDHETRLKQVAEEMREARVSAPVTMGGSSAQADSSRSEIATVEFAGDKAAQSAVGQRLELVHFIQDSSQLTPGAERRAIDAARLILVNQPSKIRVSGYSDTMGDPDYNMELSEQRAQAVADSLIAAGVDADRIEVLAFGESVLPEPTDDNVNEPLNRCVSITAIR